MIGAAPSGLAACRELTRAEIPFDRFEAEVGRPSTWDLPNPTFGVTRPGPDR